MYSTFSWNSSNSNGGAISLYQNSRVAFGDCTFEYNTAMESGGAIFLDTSSKFTQFSCNKFISNEAQNGCDYNS